MIANFDQKRVSKTLVDLIKFNLITPPVPLGIVTFGLNLWFWHPKMTKNSIKMCRGPTRPLPDIQVPFNVSVPYTVCNRLWPSRHAANTGMHATSQGCVLFLQGSSHISKFVP